MTETTVQRANEQLLDLVSEMRADWAELEVRSALVDAQECGLSWETAAWRLVRLAGDPDAQPRELVLPHERKRTADHHDPGAYDRGLAAARAALTRTETP